MDLRTGCSLWQGLRPSQLAFPVAEGDLHCDVAIIGGGITGALTAYMLLREGVSVVLLDKRTPGEGSTVASSGLLQYEIDTPLVDLARKVDLANAIHAYRRGLTAIEQLAEVAASVGSECGYSRRDSLYFASTSEHVPKLQAEYELRREHGFDVKYLSRSGLREISSIDAAGAIYSTGDGQLNQYQFTQDLLVELRGRGCPIFSQSEVTSVSAGAREVELRTCAARVVAKALVYATGYEAHQQLPSSPGNLGSTYVVASSATTSFTGWPEGCLIWETARPYFYGRQTDDGRIIIGGEDTSFAEDHNNPGEVGCRAEKLVARFDELFPQIEFQPDYAWAGTFAETKDGLAYIGQLPGRPNMYAALGYGGNGITFSMIAAKLITDLYLRRPNEDEPVFSFRR